MCLHVLTLFTCRVKIKHVFFLNKLQFDHCTPAPPPLPPPAPKSLAEKLYSPRSLKIVTAKYFVKISNELQVACGCLIGIWCFTIQSAFGFKVSNFSAAQMAQLQVPWDGANYGTILSGRCQQCLHSSR